MMIDSNGKEIKYEDYLTLNWNEYTELKVDFLDYFAFFISSDYKVFDDHVLAGFSLKKYPEIKTDEIIEGMLPNTLKEWETKWQNKNYFVCNALCANEVIKSIFNEKLLKDLSEPEVTTEIKEKYALLLDEMLSDVDQLINLFQNKIKKNNEFPSNIETRYIKFSDLHTILRQILYGNSTPYPSIESPVSISLIRQIIEIRIRRAFGTMSYIDGDSNIVPLDMARLFDVIKKFKANIEFPLKLTTIERIYKWSNMSVHTGKGDFVWIPYFVSKYFSKLNFGHIDKMHTEGWDINNGIKTTQETIDKIHQELKNTKNLDILTCPPECQILASEANLNP